MVRHVTRTTIYYLGSREGRRSLRSLGEHRPDPAQQADAENVDCYIPAYAGGVNLCSVYRILIPKYRIECEH